MQDHASLAPAGTAARVALWRALHVAVDPPPHVLSDELGLRLLAPDQDWRQRPDMDPQATRRARASIVARARCVEDLVAAEVARGVGQYAILGAGLDTFAWRRPDLLARLNVFEVERPGPQQWKQQRLRALGLAVPPSLRFVPVDFEAGRSWWQQLLAAGFEPHRPAVLAAIGVSMYLTREANAAMLRQSAALAPGSTFVLSFLVPMPMVEVGERPAQEATARAARAAGTPFLSQFSPTELVLQARDQGFATVRTIAAAELAERYFANRSDGLAPSSAEALVVATR